MSEYFNNKGPTRATFSVDGWFTIGDLGCVSGDGRVYVA